MAIVAGVVAHLLTDTPLETWTKYGPFPKEGKDRFTKTFEGYTLDEAYHALADLISQPALSIQQDFDNGWCHKGGFVPDVVVTVALPSPVSKSVTFHTEVATSERLPGSWVWSSALVSEAAYAEEPVLDASGLFVLGRRYRFRGHGEERLWRARAYYITEDGLRIPKAGDRPDSGWVHDHIPMTGAR